MKRMEETEREDRMYETTQPAPPERDEVTAPDRTAGPETGEAAAPNGTEQPTRPAERAAVERGTRPDEPEAAARDTKVDGQNEPARPASSDAPEVPAPSGEPGITVQPARHGTGRAAAGYRAGVAILAACLLFITLWSWLKPPQTMSLSERRKLAQMPEFSWESVKTGSFMQDFEKYTLDQFPLRDRFRGLKAMSEYGVFLKKDNNGLYLADGHLAEILYPLNESSLQHALRRFQTVYDTYLTESEGRIFSAIVPDKGYYLAAENGYPVIDYAALFETVEAAMPYAKPIDLTDGLDAESFYRTDSHWRQENLLGTARTLGQAMGLPDAWDAGDWETVTVREDFRGVYYGRAALPVRGEPLRYLTNDVIEGCSAVHAETGREKPIYDMEKVTSDDPYEMFLSGASALITVENPAAKAAGNDRELILFRDSFGSSLAPLLLPDYATVTIVDLRYINSSYLGSFIDFHGQDVLFLYSTGILNNSFSLQ